VNAPAKIQFGSRRSVEEWVGVTPDSKPPPHVVLRIFERANGICHIAKRKIRAAEPWDVEHVISLRDWENSGREGHGNRESNMAPALRDKHRAKTAKENRERAEANGKKAKHLGIKGRKSQGFRAWRKFDGTIVRRDES
jgi:5-methylcytosine-specific restriction endonuclease McrA